MGRHKHQLVAALLGRHEQCKHCGKYFETKKLMCRHKDNCLRDDYVWRYDYKPDSNGRYFCYFGCLATYYTVLGLEKHLTEHHNKEDLFKWGISKDHLVKKVDKQKALAARKH